MTSPWKLVGTTRTSGQPQTMKQRIHYYRQTLSNIEKISPTGSARLLNSCNIDSSIIFKNFSYFRLSEEKPLLPTTRYTRNLNFSVYIVNKVKLKGRNAPLSPDYLTQIVSGSQGSEKSHICNAIARAIYNRGKRRDLWSLRLSRNWSYIPYFPSARVTTFFISLPRLVAFSIYFRAFDTPQSCEAAWFACLRNHSLFLPAPFGSSNFIPLPHFRLWWWDINFSGSNYSQRIDRD